MIVITLCIGLGACVHENKRLIEYGDVAGGEGVGGDVGDGSGGGEEGGDVGGKATTAMKLRAPKLLTFESLDEDMLVQKEIVEFEYVDGHLLSVTEKLDKWDYDEPKLVIMQTFKYDQEDRVSGITYLAPKESGTGTAPIGFVEIEYGKTGIVEIVKTLKPYKNVNATLVRKVVYKPEFSEPSGPVVKLKGEATIKSITSKPILQEPAGPADLGNIGKIDPSITDDSGKFIDPDLLKPKPGGMFPPSGVSPDPGIKPLEPEVLFKNLFISEEINFNAEGLPTKLVRADLTQDFTYEDGVVSEIKTNLDNDIDVFKVAFTTDATSGVLSISATDTNQATAVAAGIDSVLTDGLLTAEIMRGDKVSPEDRFYKYIEDETMPVMPPMSWIMAMQKRKNLLYIDHPELLFGKLSYIYMNVD